MRKNKSLLLLLYILFFSVNTMHAQWERNITSSLDLDVDLPKLTSRKTGPYIGYQRGKYNMIEFGGEVQFKKIKLVHPKIHGARFGMAYDFTENVLGFDAAYWHQKARLGITYGGIISYRTDFDHTRIGIAPAIGFRLVQFHLQTGYTLYTPVENFENYNTFFIALKFTLINNRKIKKK